MKKDKEKISKKFVQNFGEKIFYKLSPSGGISLIVLVITIIVVIILAAAVIISLQNNNPMVEANKARINSDVANMQAIFANTVGKIMAENQDVVVIKNGQLNTVTSGVKRTDGVAKYEIKGADENAVVEGNIMFKAGNKEGTTYYTGKELPIYSSETKWYVDDQGLISVEVGGVLYGEGSKSDNPPTEVGEEIVTSDNPMLQSWEKNATTDFHAEKYKTKITKIKFEVSNKVSSNKIESWDVSEAKDKSVMAWVESDEADGYILTIAGKEKIVANTKSSYLFYEFNKVNEIENVNLLDTSNVTNMSFMFYGCNRLTSLDLGGFSTSNVTDMSFMFSRLRRCENLDLSNFDTSNVISMSNMFSDSDFVSLNLDGWDTSRVAVMGSMFSFCYNLTSLGQKGIDISGNKVDIQSMFSYAKKINTTLNVKGVLTGFFQVFYEGISESSAQITLNYTEENESVVDSLINSYPAANLVKGIKI